MTGESVNDTLLVNDQPSGPWPGIPGAPKALAMAQQAALMNNLAAHQRMAQAAAAANMHALGQIAQLPGLGMHGAPASASAHNGGEGLLGSGATGMFSKPPAVGPYHNGAEAGMMIHPLCLPLSIAMNLPLGL